MAQHPPAQNTRLNLPRLCVMWRSASRGLEAAWPSAPWSSDIWVTSGVLSLKRSWTNTSPSSVPGWGATVGHGTEIRPGRGKYRSLPTVAVKNHGVRGQSRNRHAPSRGANETRAKTSPVSLSCPRSSSSRTPPPSTPTTSLCFSNVLRGTNLLYMEKNSNICSPEATIRNNTAN